MSCFLSALGLAGSLLHRTRQESLWPPTWFEQSTLTGGPSRAVHQYWSIQQLSILQKSSFIVFLAVFVLQTGKNFGETGTLPCNGIVQQGYEYCGSDPGNGVSVRWSGFRQPAATRA